MFISTLIGRLLQSVEFFRSGFGKWFVLGFEKFMYIKYPVVVLVVWGCIKISIAVFRLFCSSVGGYLNSIGYSGIRVGGCDILAIANTVFPIDEFVGLLIAWATLYGVCASIRFARAAWAAVPLKAS